MSKFTPNTKRPIRIEADDLDILLSLVEREQKGTLSTSPLGQFMGDKLARLHTKLVSAYSENERKERGRLEVAKGK